MSSRRGYLTKEELEQFANITIEDDVEADDQISQAEEMIDSYVGQQDKFIRNAYKGQATSGSQTTLVDTSNDSHIDDFDDDYFVGCEIEILGGTNKGERRTITAYDKSTATVTVESDFTAAIDNTSIYQIYQLGKFPRYEDATSLTKDNGEIQYFKTIPEEVRRATAAQVAYIIEMGEDFLVSGATDKQSEGIGDYNYNTMPVDRLIAPKARSLLRRYCRRYGEIIR